MPQKLIVGSIPMPGQFIYRWTFIRELGREGTRFILQRRKAFETKCITFWTKFDNVLDSEMNIAIVLRAVRAIKMKLKKMSDSIYKPK